MFLVEKCNLQPTLLHYKKLARHLVIHSKMLMVLALQPIGFNKYILIIIDIQQFYISYRLPIPPITQCWSTTVVYSRHRSSSRIAVMWCDSGHAAVVWHDSQHVTVVRRDGRRLAVVSQLCGMVVVASQLCSMTADAMWPCSAMADTLHDGRHIVVMLHGMTVDARVAWWLPRGSCVA
jgi:hypothetical protein